MKKGAITLQSALESVKNEDIPKDIDFIASIIKGDCYFGSFPAYYENGFVLLGHKFTLCYFEDFIFYLLNNNIILSMIFATKGLYYSKFMRITNFFFSTTLGYFLFVMCPLSGRRCNDSCCMIY